MTLQPITYLLPDNLDLAEFEKRLSETGHFSDDPPRQALQTFLDSFDWRIWLSGAELVFEEDDSSNRLCWRAKKKQDQSECLVLEEAPGFPSQLPAGSLRERITAAVDMRILLPMVKVKQQLRILRQLNSDDKTVLRLVLQTNSYVSADGKQKGELEHRVQLQPLKGYQKPFVKMQSELQSLGLQRASQSLFVDALSGIGRRPEDYSSKLNYRLDPNARSDATAKQILLSLLHTLEENIAGTKANLDSEFLHDLRVATRRSRSAMTQIKGVFDPQELEPFKQGFAWIGKVTGPTRDMDVYLLKFADYQQSLPKKLRPDLSPFYDFLLAHHKQAQTELVSKLNSPHFRKLLKEWRQWLEMPVSNVSSQPNAVRPIAKLADQRIYKIYKRVRKDGLAIEQDSPPEMLHELRKDCKKLRYLMEFFQSLYPKPEIRRLVKLLKILLDNLGDFQDLQVQAEALESFGEQMQKEGAPASAMMAMGVLVGNLLSRQEQAREEFAQLILDFNAKQNTRAFKQLFGAASST